MPWLRLGHLSSPSVFTFLWNRGDCVTRSLVKKTLLRDRRCVVYVLMREVVLPVFFIQKSVPVPWGPPVLILVTRSTFFNGWRSLCWLVSWHVTILLTGVRDRYTGNTGVSSTKSQCNSFRWPSLTQRLSHSPLLDFYFYIRQEIFTERHCLLLISKSTFPWTPFLSPKSSLYNLVQT